jgi:hypothetical protein
LNEWPRWGDIHGMTTICRSIALALLGVVASTGLRLRLP